MILEYYILEDLFEGLVRAFAPSISFWNFDAWRSNYIDTHNGCYTLSHGSVNTLGALLHDMVARNIFYDHTQFISSWVNILFRICSKIDLQICNLELMMCFPYASPKTVKTIHYRIHIHHKIHPSYMLLFTPIIFLVKDDDDNGKLNAWIISKKKFFVLSTVE